MMRRRSGQPSNEEEESSDEEDAFSKLSRKRKKKKDEGNNITIATTSSSKDDTTESNNTNSSNNNKNEKETATLKQLPVSTTSSMKRHHVSSNDSRKAKMDAILQDLEFEKSRRPISSQDPQRGFIPEKKGSFVDPSEEHLTTNLFVGNLAPSITEEELTDLFRQFGDLYSVKIMWPRTEEERRRGRNTGFVCFMKREDAEDALQQCDETDPFNCGRRIMMRWGKSVKKIIKRGTGGVMVAPIRKRGALRISESEIQHGSETSSNKRSRTDSTGSGPIAQVQSESAESHNQLSSNPFPTIPAYDREKHEKDSIHVEIPKSAARAHFISTVANFVAKDGALLEKKLIEMEVGNPDFAFLSLPPGVGDENCKLDEQQQVQLSEHIFYRWRVYAFTQGDGYNVWRTEPFMMIKSPNGTFFIPPALNQQAAMREEQERKLREENIERQKKQRRRRVLTGRQLEQARGRAGAADGGAQLTKDEMDQFHSLARKKLCASRDSICEAMAFCFEKSGAAKQIASLLKEMLLENEKSHPQISIETRIARLYLLSDVLFNSQQPGVRNAFKYRDAIEQMAPEIFTSLGKHGSGSIGRMRRNKLATAVSAVLGAWTNWSVYNPAFLDELYARFEGKEIAKKEDTIEDTKSKEAAKPTEEDINSTAVKVIPETQRGDWTEVRVEPTREVREEHRKPDHDGDLDGEALEDEDIDGEDLDGEDLDGEDLDGDDLDGEALSD